ncbi:MAG TPA: ABC transporter ATP-binding protein [Anaerolineaceae bacterium]|nr:ABC transporter ATP-binding protein [Anaerolineaceae bacterium]
MTATPTPNVLRSATRQQLVEILSPHRLVIGFIAGAILLGAGLELIPPLVMKQVVDGHLATGISAGLWPLAFLYLASVAGVQGLGFLSSYLTALAAQGALRDLRVRLYRHLQCLPLGYHDQTPLGDTISRCTADVDTLDTLFSSGVAGLITDLVRLVTVSIAMIALSPPLSLVSALIVPPLLWVTNAFRKRIRAAERRNRQAVGLMNTHLQETLGGMEVIRAFGREVAFDARFRRVLKQTLDAYNQAAKYSALYQPIMQILMAAVIALLLWSGARATFANWQISLGTLTAFVLLFKRFFDPITALGEEWQTVQSALSGAERIFQVLNMPVEETGAEAPHRTASPAGINVSQLTFGYFPDQPVLRQVSFIVQPGEHVALVGRTGAGKSSIVHLLGGLYTPWQGDLRVAGLDPRQMPEDERRKVIGVVPQAVQLFSGTVLENLTLGDANVPFAAVENAAITAGADAFIRSLPQGYDTSVNSGSGGGVQLSSGQRQLLSLARALVWNPPVLLFDEATSAIDSASEAAFRQALEQESSRHQRAILTVAHRLSTARAADRVIVLDNGRILEIGAPDELVRQGGRFAALLELEAAGWDWRNNPT